MSRLAGSLEERDTILWKRLDGPGHEFAQVTSGPDGHTLSGTAVFLSNGKPCCLRYTVTCLPSWETRSVSVAGMVGMRPVQLSIRVSPEGDWWLNGVEQPAVRGCVDVDLAFSPVTNLLPIRRGKLEVGQSLAGVAAWLRFPSFVLEPLSQTYTRRSDSLYHYSSNAGAFESDLTVRPSGLVRCYPGLWQAEEA